MGGDNENRWMEERKGWRRRRRTRGKGEREGELRSDKERCFSNQ